MTVTPENSHIWDMDGVCRPHKGACGTQPFVVDPLWEKASPTRRIPTVGSLLARNRQLIAANSRVNQRNERQGEYIQFLHNWFKSKGMEIPKQGGGK